MDRDDDDATDPRAHGAAAPLWGPEWTAASVIDALEPLVIERRRERIRSVVEQRLGTVTVLMDAPYDPHNGAAVVRSCDAFGVQDVHVVPRGGFLVAAGVTKGTERWVDVHVHPTGADAIAALRALDFRLVATRPEGELLPEDLAEIPRVALLLGNEHDGLRAELEAAADTSVRVPMRGMVESLNVSVSAAILLAHATRGRPGDLSEERKRELYARGLHRSTPRADEVLRALHERRSSP